MRQEALVVYVVDDDLAVRTGLSRFIRAAGLQAQPFGSIEDLLSGADTGQPGCVLVDLSASRREGRSLAARLRERGAAFPLIAISGDERDSAAGEARACGASFLLRKPVDGRALLDAIEWVTSDTTEGEPS